MSDLKGGKLAQLAFPAKVVGLILSDIVDDPIELVKAISQIPTAAYVRVNGSLHEFLFFPFLLTS